MFWNKEKQPIKAYGIDISYGKRDLPPITLVEVTNYSNCASITNIVHCWQHEVVNYTHNNIVAFCGSPVERGVAELLPFNVRYYENHFHKELRIACISHRGINTNVLAELSESALNAGLAAYEQLIMESEGR